MGDIDWPKSNFIFKWGQMLLHITLRFNAVIVWYESLSASIGWVKEVKRGKRQVGLAPRLLYDGWSMQDYKAVFQSEEEIKNLADTIVKFYQVFVMAHILVYHGTL